MQIQIQLTFISNTNMKKKSQSVGARQADLDIIETGYLLEFSHTTELTQSGTGKKSPVFGSSMVRKELLMSK